MIPAKVLVFMKSRAFRQMFRPLTKDFTATSRHMKCGGITMTKHLRVEPVFKYPNEKGEFVLRDDADLEIHMTRLELLKLINSAIKALLDGETPTGGQ
jgi:hypothetical protein